ncbi:Dynein beta chain, flagellar outer arm, partial [Cymbomonas tetramitiformis]
MAFGLHQCGDRFRLREADNMCFQQMLQPRGGRAKIDEVPTPYQMVAIQETERMNILLTEMKRSLAELDLGLKGDLTMSGPMELIMGALANDSVPGGWAKL